MSLFGAFCFGGGDCLIIPGEFGTTCHNRSFDYNSRQYI